MEHTFHTRHDFTPDLGWAAFQLLAAFGTEGVEVDGIEDVLEEIANGGAGPQSPATGRVPEDIGPDETT